jgi:hypothetical protein
MCAFTDAKAFPVNFVDKIKFVQQQLQLTFNNLPQSRERAMVSRWQEEAAFFAKQRETRLKILAAVRDGYDTITEISSETRIPRSTCYKLLRKLVSEDALLKTRVECPPDNFGGKHFEFKFELNIK